MLKPCLNLQKSKKTANHPEEQRKTAFGDVIRNAVKYANRLAVTLKSGLSENPKH